MQEAEKHFRRSLRIAQGVEVDMRLINRHELPFSPLDALLKSGATVSCDMEREGSRHAKVGEYLCIASWYNDRVIMAQAGATLDTVLRNVYVEAAKVGLVPAKG